MSLQYVIDGYNIINNPLFIRLLPKRKQDTRVALLELIRAKRLCGSRNNKVTVVFDGYQDSRYPDSETQFRVVFSSGESADEKIMSIISKSANVKNTLVISDDKEIMVFARGCGALTQGVEEFLGSKRKAEAGKEDLAKAELSYSQIHNINNELRKLWLK